MADEAPPVADHRRQVGRKLISRGGSLYARTILGVKLRDVTAGFICWRRRAPAAGAGPGATSAPPRGTPPCWATTAR